MKIFCAVFLTYLLFAIGTSNPIFETVDEVIDVYIPKVAEKPPDFVAIPLLDLIDGVDKKYDWIAGTPE